MDVNRIWILIGKKISGDATVEDVAELDSLMSGRIDTMYPLRELEEMWFAEKYNPDQKSPAEIKEKWEQFKSKSLRPTNVVQLNPKKNKINRLIWLAACTFIIAATAVLIIGNYTTNTNLLTTVVQAPAGSTSQVILPDGSKVWLNANSKLTYKKQFGENFREVNLVGEAFFDVVKDANHPFIVNTASLHLKVLGTAFNVRSFANDKTSEAALVRGSIEVTLVNNPDKKITLKPTEKIIVRNIKNDDYNKSVSTTSFIGNKKEQIPLIILSNIHYKENETLPVEVMWIERKLVFTSLPFDDLAVRMERYYNVSIGFQDEAEKNLVFSGIFVDENINDAMKALQATGNFHYKSVNNKITIYK
jgi:transmembrane sensor